MDNAKDRFVMRPLHFDSENLSSVIFIWALLSLKK